MSEFSKKTHFSSLILSDLYLFCSFIMSHPLYFFSFIFFCPYLFNLVSFLSPLVFSTFLLLSVFLTFGRLKSKTDGNGEEEIDQFEDLEVYKVVFDTSGFDLEQNLAHYTPEIEIKETISTNEVVIPIGSELINEGKKLGVFLHQVEEEQRQKQVKAVIFEEQNLPRANSERSQQNPWDFVENDGEEMYSTPKSVEQSPSMRSNGSFGSMRKEREWRRTLACKLFEERHNSDGMDMLWETYETDSMKLQAKSKSKRGKKIECYDEEENEAGQLCCLQALKFSTGKMNLGMGKPNLLKISKAFKGIGWLRHVSKKKAYH